MPSMIKSRHLGYAVLCVVLIAASGKLIIDKPAETPTQRAYAECRQCGLSDAEIIAMIESVRRRGLTREEEVRLFDSTFGPDDDHREACMPCLGSGLGCSGYAVSP